MSSVVQCQGLRRDGRVCGHRVDLRRHPDGWCGQCLGPASQVPAPARDLMALAAPVDPPPGAGDPERLPNPFARDPAQLQRLGFELEPDDLPMEPTRQAVERKLGAVHMMLMHRDRLPYMAPALANMRPVYRRWWQMLQTDEKGRVLGSVRMAVDPYWRWYINLDWASQQTVPELAVATLHECWHLLRLHAQRTQAQGVAPEEADVANIACDMEINDDLISGVVLAGEDKIRGPWPRPEVLDIVLPQQRGLPEDQLAEWYLARLRQMRCPQCGRFMPGRQNGSGGQGQGQGQGQGSQGQGSKKSPGSQGQGSQGQGQGQDQGQGQGSSGAGGTCPGCGRPMRGSSGSGDSSGQGSPGSGDSSGQGSSGSGAPTLPPPEGRPDHPNCGSGGGNRPGSWELPPDDPQAPGLEPGAAATVVYDTMVEIDRAAKQRGNVPGGWARLADEALRPQVDWRKELAAQVRQALARAAGQVDYNRDRPSRRTPLVRGLIRPRMVRPIPNVAVVVDTSGSMSDRELGQALSEVQQVLDQVLGGQSAQVLAVDAAVQATRRVWSAKQVRLAGGGGTDMGKGIQAAAQLQPLPDTVIVLTDGFTPWPKDPPPGQRVIVGIIGAERPGRLEPREHSTPEWAAAVGIPVGEPARAHNG